MAVLNWGILGTGTIAQEFARDLRFVKTARLVAVASRDHNRAKAFAESVGVAKWHGRYEDLYSDDCVDVIYVASTNESHAEHARACLYAGKPVLCEKPITVSAEEAAVVAALSEERKLFCMEGLWTRFLPAVRAFRHHIKAGYLGKITHLHAEYGLARERRPTSGHFDSRTRDGVLLDLGIYCVSLAVHFLSLPRTVSCQMLIGPTGVDEHVSIQLGYLDASVSLVTSMRTTLANTLTVYGTEGWATLRSPLVKPEWMVHGSVISAGSEGGRGSAIRHNIARHPGARAIVRAFRGGATFVGKTNWYPVKGYGLWAEIEEVGRCLTHGLIQSPEMPLQESVAIMHILDLARESAMTSTILPFIYEV